MHNFSTELVLRRCETEHQVLINKLAIARFRPEQVPFLFEDHSLLATVAGEVMFISKCRPTLVKIKPTDKCYDAIRV